MKLNIDPCIEYPNINYKIKALHVHCTMYVKSNTTEYVRLVFSANTQFTILNRSLGT